MLGNKKLNNEEILRCHKNATIERMKGHPVVLAVQDTISIIHKTNASPNEPYPIADAVRYVAQLGGFIGVKSDGPPGLKVIWFGLDKLYTLISYRQFLL